MHSLCKCFTHSTGRYCCVAVLQRFRAPLLALPRELPDLHSFLSHLPWDEVDVDDLCERVGPPPGPARGRSWRVGRAATAAREAAPSFPGCCARRTVLCSVTNLVVCQHFMIKLVVS